jgi:fructose-1,6-bisphosphatase
MEKLKPWREDYNEWRKNTNWRGETRTECDILIIEKLEALLEERDNVGVNTSLEKESNWISVNSDIKPKSYEVLCINRFKDQLIGHLQLYD